MLSILGKRGKESAMREEKWNEGGQRTEGQKDEGSL